MLLEKVRRSGFTGQNSIQKNQHKQENGLGTKIPTWLSRELSRLADEFDIGNESGRPMSFSTTDCFPECSNTIVAAYLDKKSSKQVVGQVALLCRLRSVCLKNSDENLQSKIMKAIKNSKGLEDTWEKRPDWWCDSSVEHTALMLHKLNEHGFLNFSADSSGFGPADEVSTPNMPCAFVDPGFYLTHYAT